MKKNFRMRDTALLMTLAAAYPLQAHALAGVVQFAAGEASVRQTDGKVIALAKGSDIDSGQAIVTGSNGRVQVKFTDGGLVSLQPNTEFKISNYVDQNDPKQDRFLVDLLRGGMRAITGLIGKRNRENYKLTTTTATIGIRGSGFKVGYNPDGTLGITSELDKIEVCNQSGCIGLVAGESVRVIDNVTPPVRTSEQAKMETPSKNTDPAAVSEKVTPEGRALVITTVTETKTATTPATTAAATTVAITTGSFNGMLVRALYGPQLSTTTTVTAGGALTVLDAGKVTKFTDASFSYVPNTVGSSGFLGDTATNDFIGWGVWNTATRDNLVSPSPISVNFLHYVAGQPTVVMPTTGIASYSLVGSTAPTLYTGASGTLNSATFSVNFGTVGTVGGVTASMVTSFGTVSGTNMSISGARFANANIRGFFSGANAARAGLYYRGNSAANSNGNFEGVAVFQK